MISLNGPELVTHAQYILRNGCVVVLRGPAVTSFERRSTTATGTALSRRSGLRNDPLLTLVAVTLGVIMVGVDGTVVAVANPYIGRDLHAVLGRSSSGSPTLTDSSSP